MEGPEFYVLMLLSAAGGVIMAMGNDLIVIFIGLETLSIAVYVLSGMHLRRVQSQESGIKYFVLGAFSSAFFLYGIALIYGATGSTNLVDIKNFMSGVVPTQNGLLLIGLGLLIVGLAFKVSAVPFHAWSPDVYDGAPTPAVAWMASGVKAAPSSSRRVSISASPIGSKSAEVTPMIAWIWPRSSSRSVRTSVRLMFSITMPSAVMNFIPCPSRSSRKSRRRCGARRKSAA
jgi:NADH-quinone oxidoreductase subunit N